MKLNKDLIIVHFQCEFVDKPALEDNDPRTNKLKVALRKKIVKTIPPYINAAYADKNTYLSIFEEAKKFDAEGSLVYALTNVKQLEKDKVNWFFAPQGDAFDPHPDGFKLHCNNVVLIGGWIGACINFALTTVIKTYFEDTTLHTNKTLTITLPQNLVFKTMKTLEELENFYINNFIETTFSDTMDIQGYQYPQVIKDAGLTYSILRNNTSISNGDVTVIETRNSSEKFHVDIIIE